MSGITEGQREIIRLAQKYLGESDAIEAQTLRWLFDIDSPLTMNNLRAATYLAVDEMAMRRIAYRVAMVYVSRTQDAVREPDNATGVPTTIPPGGTPAVEG